VILRVEFEVEARDLDTAIAAAEAKLEAFAPTIEATSWHVTMRCSPFVETTDGNTMMWRCEIEAVRGATSGPPRFKEGGYMAGRGRQ
jgi:hypothetical protein